MPQRKPKYRPGTMRGQEDPLSYATMLRDQTVRDEVARAVEAKRVIMAYQPVVTTEDISQIGFYEGLARVVDPNGRIIPAGEFIEAVETTETGRQIDCLALEHGMTALTQHPDLKLSINMSARSIGYLQWNRTLERFLRKDPTIGERLILEITEQSAILVPELVASFMTDLQHQGISFAIDDFGSGFSSFRYLKNFYFDILKIDGQFIRGLAGDTDNQIITRSIIGMAREFGMLTVAEQVENEKDLRHLIRLGVDCMQGYFFGAPMIRPPWQPELPEVLRGIRS